MGGSTLGFNFVDIVDPVEIDPDSWKRVLGNYRELKIYLDKYLWLAGRTRRERLILAGLRLMPFGLGREPILLSIWRNEYIGLYEVEELLIKEGPRALLCLAEGVSGRIEVAQREFRHLMVPPAEEFTRFTSWVFKLGRKAVDVFGWPDVSHPPPSLVERVIKKMELEGIRQPDKYKPHTDYRPSRLSPLMKLFIVMWRCALLKAYGLSIKRCEDRLVYFVCIEEAENKPLPEPCRAIEGITLRSVGSGGANRTLEEECLDLLFNSFME